MSATQLSVDSASSRWFRVRPVYVVDPTYIGKYYGMFTNDMESDFAGSRRTHKSTTLAVICYGGHTVKTLSLTQFTISLSSRKSEYDGTIKFNVKNLSM